MAKRLDLDTDEIVRLYVEEGLRGATIAERLGCSDGAVYARLKEAGVRASSRARLDLDVVVRMYVEEGRSLWSIGTELGVAPQTVGRFLRQAGVPIRSHAEAHRVAGTKPCPSSVVLRSYLLGFAAGDLFVRKIHNGGTTIAVSCSTTHAEQVDLIRSVFGAFGPTYASGRSVRVSLDLSFAFLLEKYERTVPAWISGDRPSAAFAAGYIDAEGSFGVYEGRAKCKVASYDAEVIQWLGRWSEQIGVRSVVAVVARHGDRRSDGLTYNGDLWRWTVNAAPAIIRLVGTLDPYLQHERRRAAAARAHANARERLTLRVQ